jgi:hypothetical protein
VGSSAPPPLPVLTVAEIDQLLREIAEERQLRAAERRVKRWWLYFWPPC